MTAIPRFPRAALRFPIGVRHSSTDGRKKGACPFYMDNKVLEKYIDEQSRLVSGLLALLMTGTKLGAR